jgi:uncharacterized protein
METLSPLEARRLALARAGLLKPGWTGMPARAAGRGGRARRGALDVVRRFGYLQLDTVSVAGARSHAIVLASRLDGFDPALGEELLLPGEPLFEYWGHEASWIPIELYPAFAWRRREYRHHPWWGDLIGQHPEVARKLMKKVRDEGPLRSVDMEGRGGSGWWQLKTAKKVATALWSAGELAIRERRAFQRSYDLTERVIPEPWRRKPLAMAEGLRVLLLQALAGHGWATAGTLAATWRLKNRGKQVAKALAELADAGEIVPCGLVAEGRRIAGWARPADLELVQRLAAVRPRRDRGVLLSPFDPLLWDRARVRLLFGFDQVLEIFKPAPRRIYGYYCLPVLAGDRLVARVDLKAERRSERAGGGTLRVLSLHYEADSGAGRPPAADRAAVDSALERYGGALGLRVVRTGG